MLIVMDKQARQEQVDEVVAVVESLGYQAKVIPGADRVAIGVGIACLVAIFVLAWTYLGR